MKIEVDFEKAWELKMRLEIDINNIKNGRDFGDIEKLRALSSELDFVEVPTTGGSVYVSDYGKFIPFTKVPSHKLILMGIIPIKPFKNKFIYHSDKTGKFYVAD